MAEVEGAEGATHGADDEEGLQDLSAFSMGPGVMAIDPHGLVDKQEVFAVRQRILKELFGDLAEYCMIPKGFHHCQLETCEMNLDGMDDDSLKHLIEHPQGQIINPQYQHHEAIQLFGLLLAGDHVLCKDRDPLRPLVGAYLCGPPGCGKTHIMAAYALKLREHLDIRLENFYRNLDEQIIEILAEKMCAMANDPYEESAKSYDLENDSGENHVATPEEVFEQRVQGLKQRCSYFDIKPTDVLYIGFDPLFELWTSPERSDALEALIKVPVVFIDDMHPKDDPERLALIQHVIERRYEEGQPATFITSNRDTEKLVQGNEDLAQRVTSRCGELFYKIDFTGCDDWRITVRQRKIEIVRKRVQGMLAEEGITPKSI